MVAAFTGGQLPGTPQHQALLRTIADHYRDDPRVRAITVYGSLARGDWDEYSDVDAAVIVVDSLPIDAAWVEKEVTRLAEAQLLPLVAARSGSDEGDLLLSLPAPMHVAIQYRPLARTSPFIGDNLLLIAGGLDEQAIRAAADANRATWPALRPRSLPQLLATCLLNTASVDLRLHRRQYWRAYESLFTAVRNLVELFTFSRGGTRPLPTFETAADAALKQRLGKALPAYDPHALQRAYLTLLAILEQDLEHIASGRVQLTDEQRTFITHLRQRHQSLALSSG